jgi:hypothetical protein
MARLAYDTVREMMAAAVDEPDPRPGWPSSSAESPFVKHEAEKHLQNLCARR